ncbi:hypothetical protein F2Q70_00000256 [Brassica cretica]|uniref:Uncharacterized protein n=1 Tax=Brassica cretica TaxID=69181 RepID=A0A8S9INT9_BRACR|nr:hypothetical protein F2Q70_00000256 [Brassica cretica]
MDWCKKSATVGAAWVVRDSHGWIQEHSRRSFSSISSVLDANLAVFLWVIESITSLKKNKVVFVSEFQEMVDDVVHPSHWPVLQFQASELRVTRVAEFERLSYVDAGHPRWLDSLFVDERVPSSL